MNASRDTKILQAILDGQTKIHSRIDTLEKNLKAEIKTNRDRIDKLGLYIAEVDDDAPSEDEFMLLEKRVTKLEKKVAVL